MYVYVYIHLHIMWIEVQSCYTYHCIRIYIYLFAGLLQFGLQVFQLLLHTCHLVTGRLKLLQAHFIAPSQLLHLTVQ